MPVVKTLMRVINHKPPPPPPHKPYLRSPKIYRSHPRWHYMTSVSSIGPGQLITILSDVGPQNITVGCWEFSLNLSLPAQLFEHPTVILWRPVGTRAARWGLLCYGRLGLSVDENVLLGLILNCVGHGRLLKTWTKLKPSLMEWVIDKIDSINKCKPTCGASGHSEYYTNWNSFPSSDVGITQPVIFISTTNLAQLKNLAQTPFTSRMKTLAIFRTMNGESRLLVPDELVELEKSPVESSRLQESSIHHFRGIYGIYL
jgi:hypothetical protein